MWFLCWHHEDKTFMRSFFIHTLKCECVWHVCSACPAVCGHLSSPSILSTRSYLCQGVSVGFIRPCVKLAVCQSWSQRSGRMFNEPGSDDKRADILCVLPGRILTRPPQRLKLNRTDTSYWRHHGLSANFVTFLVSLYSRSLGLCFILPLPLQN